MKKILLIALLAFVLPGCISSIFEPPHRMEKSAEQLAADGAAAFMNKDYKDAVKAYTDLKDWYPFSKYAMLAELKIADSNFHLERYDEAIVAYEQFERLHPRNEAIPYVINQIGLSWFNQIDTVDRDHSPAQNAMAQFQRLLEQFPNSEYAQKAPANINKCIDNIAGHELYVAEYYLKTKQYKAALERFRHIVEFYPGTEQSKTALARIPEVTPLAASKEE